MSAKFFARVNTDEQLYCEEEWPPKRMEEQLKSMSIGSIVVTASIRPIYKQQLALLEEGQEV